MRIGIDTTFLFDQYSRRGIGNYGKELVSRLISEPGHTWVLFGFADLKANLDLLKVKKAANIEFVRLGNPRKSNPLNILYFQLFYRKKIKHARLDAYFAASFERGLPLGITKTVVMMHDVIPYITKSFSQKGQVLNWIKGLFYNHNLKRARQADLVLTNSDFSKRELINKANFDSQKVKRIYLGINESFREHKITDDMRDVRRTLIIYKITKPYILYYGGLEANKNVNTLLYAFNKLSQRFPDLKLVIAGKEFKVGWDNKAKPQSAAAQNLMDLIFELKLRHKVIITGEIDTKHLPIVMQNAELFVHLSTYEGFGFSVLEAAAAGTPVVAARRSCYPEILEEAVEFVDPEQNELIADAIKSILENSERKKQLHKKGLALSAKYNWQETARLTLAELENMGQQVSKMKIAYLIPYFYPFNGGAEANCLALAKEMVALGHEVHVFTSNSKIGEHPIFEDYQGIKIHRFNRLNEQYYLGIYPGMFWPFISKKFDIVHAHGFGFMWHDFCLVIKKLLFAKQTKFINTPHGPFMAHEYYSLAQRLLRTSYTLLQKVFLNWLYAAIIQVNPEQKSWIKNYRIKEHKIHYLPNGIASSYLEQTEINKDTLVELGLNRKFVIAFTGRYEQYKGLQDILYSMSKLRSTQRNLKLVAMGRPGKYLSELKRMVQEEGLENQVLLLENPDDHTRDQVLELANIFILPSQWEAFGISILEAMAKKNAIITTRTEGGLFLVKDDQNGYLYEYGDVNELTRLITKLIKNKDLLKKIQEQNYQKAQEFTWDKIGKNYYNLLWELIK